MSLQNNFNSSLSHEPTVLFDGGTGFLLLDQGYTRTKDRLLLPLTTPDVLKTIHQSYVKAGANYILTHTFLATRSEFTKIQESQKWKPAVESAIQIAKNSSLPTTKIAASLGPVLQSKEETSDQLSLYIDNDVDAILAETQSNPKQIEWILNTFEKQNSNKTKLFLSLTPFDKNISHSIFENFIQSTSVFAVGMNCLGFDENTFGFCNWLTKNGQKKLILRPNAGTPQKKDKKWVYPIDDDTFCDQMEKLLSLKPWGIGGCCGTTPQTIKKMHARFKQY